jgi:hypothetical protein
VAVEEGLLVGEMELVEVEEDRLGAEEDHPVEEVLAEEEVPGVVEEVSQVALRLEDRLEATTPRHRQLKQACSD